MTGKHIREQLVPKGRTIFFNEEAHKYTNELGFVYTSVTTVIGKYTEDFKTEEIAKACERIGKNPNHPKYLHYKGKSWQQLIKEWKDTTKQSCDFGTKRHNYLEQAVKNSNHYNKNAEGFIDDKIYTIDDIIKNHSYGKLNLSYFKKQNVHIQYPSIYELLVSLTNAGYHIYAEIGVYDDTYGISGLIDILCVNHKTLDFIIVDWKTNKAPIRFEAGYFEKKTDGRLDLDKWKSKNEFFKYPLNMIPDSTGHHYAMQLSTYAYLVTTFGYSFKGLILCHIRPIEETIRNRDEWNEEINIISIPYMLNESKLMLDDFRMRNFSQSNIQF